MRKNEIQSFVEALEAKALNGKTGNSSHCWGFNKLGI